MGGELLQVVARRKGGAVPRNHHGADRVRRAGSIPAARRAEEQRLFEILRVVLRTRWAADLVLQKIVRFSKWLGTFEERPSR